MPLIVCPLASVAEVAAASRPSHIISLLAPGQDGIVHAGSKTLALRFHDISAPQDGLSPPDEAMIAGLLDFGSDWDGAAPLLVHCWFGISRSPAAAFILLCQWHPQVPEIEIARAVRRAMPFASPNRLMVALADARLERDGRMVEAVAAIGRGDGLFVGSHVELPDPSSGQGGGEPRPLGLAAG
jgi:predicted protein tyrosine phosphatase